MEMAGTMLKEFVFGQFTLPASEIFFTSKYSIGLVNYKPILPGHVLVIPKRKSERLKDLTNDELVDLFQSARDIGQVIEREFHAQALTISMQDGKEAGQSVYHVHVHILPRKLGDFQRNDDIYDKINECEGEMNQDFKAKVSGVDASEDRQPRSIAEMEQEAKWLRTFFNQYDKLE